MYANDISPLTASVSRSEMIIEVQFVVNKFVEWLTFKYG